MVTSADTWQLRPAVESSVGLDVDELEERGDEKVRAMR